MYRASLVHGGKPEAADKEEGVLRMQKWLRRRTIYIPSDDTTIRTIHPGQQHNHSECGGLSLQFEDLKEAAPYALADLRDRTRVRRAGRKSLAAVPRRAPIQPILAPLREQVCLASAVDSAPQKENILPSVLMDISQSDRIKLSEARRASIFEPIAAPSMRFQKLPRLQVSQSNGPRKNPRDGCKVGQRVQQNGRTAAKESQKELEHKHMSVKYNETCKFVQPIVPNIVIAPLVPSTDIVVKPTYEVLQEDIVYSEMFEDAWLSHQEAALRQLVNRIFETASSGKPCQIPSYASRRRSLLSLYQGADFLLTHRRLQASLLYGTLSPSKEAALEHTRLFHDVAFRQRFTAFWTGTYELSALSAAVEVITGRSTPDVGTRGLENGQNWAALEPERKDIKTYNPKGRRRVMESFLQTFLLRSDDAVENDRSSSPSGWCWRRTMLRCLMLILLLDKARVKGFIHNNLFLARSKYKSSGEVLAGFAGLLYPSVGDISRLLSYLDYRLNHVQYPLSEYNFQIKNLASEFRDGVRLVRMVELLLYPPRSESAVEEDVTVTMPKGQTMTSSFFEGQSWILSQHLRIPCLSRSQKVFNVQIALSALTEIFGRDTIFNGFSAAHIVDGHQEKTLGLLWNLIEKCDLGCLIDFQDLRREIGRIGKNQPVYYGQSPDMEEKDETALNNFQKQTSILKSWARSIAWAHGRLRVDNLTTSFADGKVFEAIVDEYRQYMPQKDPSGDNEINHAGLEAKLKEMGCDSSFGKTEHFRSTKPMRWMR